MLIRFPATSTACGRDNCRALLRLELLEQRTVPSFLPPVNYPAGMQPSSVAVGDFANTGTPDLAVTNLFTNNVSVFLGNSDGTFQPAVNYPVGMNPRFIAMADLTRSGIADLLVVNHVGSFSTGSVSVLRGNGDGTFQPSVNYAVGTGPATLAVGDFNNDGVPDLVVTNINSSNVSILLGNGDGTFQPAFNVPVGATPESVKVTDLNGDGNADLVVTNRTSNMVSVLLGNGDGTFRPPVSYGTGTEPFSLVVADFLGDGNFDLAIANRFSNNVSVLLGNGDGTFQPAVNYAAGPSPWSIAAADFDGDGNLDLVVANNAARVSVLLGNGDGTFQAPLPFMAGSGPFSVAVEDFNGDGLPDLAVANRFSNNVSVLINAGDWSGGHPSGGHRPSKGVAGSGHRPALLISTPVKTSTQDMTVDRPATETAVDHLLSTFAGNDRNLTLWSELHSLWSNAVFQPPMISNLLRWRTGSCEPFAGNTELAWLLLNRLW